MFTGLVEELGRVKQINDTQNTTLTTTTQNTINNNNDNDNTEFEIIIEAVKVLADCSVGDSISINGTCLTVTQFTSNHFKVGISPETLNRTNLGLLKVGQMVNLERAISVNQRFGGHFVQGHVDSTCEIIDRWSVDQSIYFKLSIPDGYAALIVEKGYVALDGVSLTVCAVHESLWFTVMLISYTQSHVTLPSKSIGDLINLEVDLVGKYVQRSILLSKCLFVCLFVCID